MPDYDPIPLLENAGYTEQEAAFLYLVAVHSGYFLRRQFCRFVSAIGASWPTALYRRAGASITFR